MRDLVANLRPVHVERAAFRHAYGLGFTFYRFGFGDENRSLTVHLGRTEYTWEWTR